MADETTRPTHARQRPWRKAPLDNPALPTEQPWTWKRRIAVEPDAKDLEIAQLREKAARITRTGCCARRADMENLRKRTAGGKAEAKLYAAGTNFARDLERLRQHEPGAGSGFALTPAEERDEMTKNLLAGVELTERELLKVFERYNIRKVETVGAKFDPQFPPGAVRGPTKDHPPGTVVQEMQSGFAIGERCLRPAMVAWRAEA